MTDDATITPPDGAANVSARSRPVGQQSARRWSFWRILGWSLLTLTLLIMIAAAYVWSNRYSLVEDMFIGALAEQGVDGTLSIDRMNRTGAVISDVDLRIAGQPVFSAKRIAADYEWRDALNGAVKKLVLDNPKLAVTVDAQGRVTDGWMPATDASGQGTALPKNGIVLNNADVTVSSPYGTINGIGDVTVMSLEDISADLRLTQTTLHYQDVSSVIKGDIELRRLGPVWDIEMDADLTDLMLGSRTIQTAKIEADLTVDTSAGYDINGPAVLSFDDLDTNRFTAAVGEIDWFGRVLINKGEKRPASIRGNWAASFDKAAVKNETLADELADKLTLFDTLSATPISEAFAAGLRGDVRAVLDGVDVEGIGAIDWNDTVTKVSLSAPLKLSSQRTDIAITSLDLAPLYIFDNASERIKIAANMSMVGRYPVSVKNLIAAVASDDGISFDGLEAVSARLERKTIWRANTEGRDVRLAPSNIDMSYNKGESRRLKLQGPIEFDGPVPSGFATGLTARGTLDVRLGKDKLEANFLPQNGSVVKLSKFETLTDWTAIDTTLTLLNGGTPLFVKTSSGSTLNAVASALTTSLIEAETQREILLDIGGITAQGRIEAEHQSWNMQATEALVKTDDFISPETVMRAKTATVTAVLTADKPTQITVNAPAAEVSTPQFSVSRMPFSLTGTSEQFKVEYGAPTLSAQMTKGLIRMTTGGALPVLPIKGTLDYDKGLITGRAQTVLPKAEDIDINIDYRMKDGVGTAQVVVPSLFFARGKLQPQDFVTSLQGKIADVNGSVSALINLAFATGEPLTSSGRVRVNDLNFGTLPGPFSGVSTEIDFDSFFPLTTSGEQTLHVESFNPGLALNDGVIKYELVDNGIKIKSAMWPLAGGQLSIDPTVWIYDAPKNDVVVRIDGVSISAFLEKVGGENLRATGDVQGVIPVTVAGVNVTINNGQLSVKDGGVIQYRTPQLKSVVDLIPEEFVTLEDYRQFQKVRKDESLGDNVGKDLAFTALRNFEYKSLSATLNGALDGEVAVNLQFEGRNPKILAGTRFDFNINVVGELVNLLRGLKVDSGFDRLKGYIDMGKDDVPLADTPIDDTRLNDNSEESLALTGYSSQIQTQKDIKP